MVVLEWLGAEKTAALSKAVDIAEKLRIALSRIYYLADGEHAHHGSGSIGLTLFQENTKNESELLKRADVAMYEAKELGKNRVSFYSEERQLTINKKSALAHDLQSAFGKEEFSLYFQPQIFANGNLGGAEALLRWLPPGKDPISPGVFIPVAESTGMILPLGEWVIERACNHLIELEKIGLPEGFALAVNISARQFNDDSFVDKVKAIIDRTRVNIHRLKFELTESCLVQDLQRVNHILSALREMGLAIELDDFETGYSSLNSLNNLPINTLKIDGSLVQGIDANSTKAIVRATIAMAKAMSMQVIGEGVETSVQRAFLVEEGCDMFQGFYCARPMPYDSFVNYLKRQTGKSRFKVIDAAVKTPMKSSIAYPSRQYQ